MNFFREKGKTRSGVKKTHPAWWEWLTLAILLQKRDHYLPGGLFVLDALNLTILSWPEAIFRICLAIVFGFVIGWERDQKNKPIDFRAYMIICSTTCIIAILGQELYADFSEANHVVKIDLGTITSGILTGIGFLGAGAIIKMEGDRVVGTATGASIWASGGIGLTLGFGFYGLAILGFLAIVFALLGGGYLYRKISS